MANRVPLRDLRNAVQKRAARVAQSFTENEAWNNSSKFAAPNCHHCHGQGTYDRWMAGDSYVTHLCHCIRGKKGFVPEPGGMYDHG